MTKLPFLILILATLSSFTFSEVLPIGAVMRGTSVKLKDVSGSDITLKDAQGKKGTLVMFSCNTCPYVVANQERTIAICKYAKEKGLGVVVVNSNEAQRTSEDSFEEMKSYAKTQSYNWYYVVDNKSAIADAFGATRTPENYLFNSEGKLVYHGAIDDNPSDASQVSRQHLKIAIDELLSGNEISVKNSRSVGCTIKRI